MRLEHRTLFGDSVSSASGEPTPSDLPDGAGSVGGWQHTRRGAAAVDAQRARDRIEAVILAGTVPLLLTDPTAASIRGGRQRLRAGKVFFGRYSLRQTLRSEVAIHIVSDTFAVSLLLSGVELSHVSVLLGHASIKITERHYAPWVKARQKQLEDDVRRTWGPMDLDQHESTHGV